jgi:hypothetical protein
MSSDGEECMEEHMNSFIELMEYKKCVITIKLKADNFGGVEEGTKVIRISLKCVRREKS